MSNAPLEQLGKRLQACRQQAGLDVSALALRTGVDQSRILAFEHGNGGLGLAQLTRLARELGVAVRTFLHVDAPAARASRAPAIMLKTQRVASLPEQDAEQIARYLHRARRFAELGQLLRVEKLCDAFEPGPPPPARPYLDGYRVAREVRTLLPERQGAIQDLQRLLENRFDILVVEHEFTNPAVVGASCRMGPARLVVVSKRIPSETQRRFVLAHELGHQLLDLEEQGVSVDEGQVEDAGWWLENPPAEKRSNAFAAMFLAPDFAVRSLLGDPRPEGYGLKDAHDLVMQARAQFGVSYGAMAWHLLNLKYLKDDETVRALIRTRPGDRGPVDFEHLTAFDGLERRVFEALEKDLISEGRARELLGGPIPEHDR